MNLTSKLPLINLKEFVEEIKEYYPEINLCDWEEKYMLVQELACMEQKMIMDNSCCYGSGTCYTCPLSFQNEDNMNNIDTRAGIFSYCARGALRWVK